MRRSEQREHIFKLLFMTQFNSENEMSDQVSMYFDTLGELEEKDQEAIQNKYQHILEHLDEIVSMDGVDGIFVGPLDLSIAMGMPLKLDDPQMQDTILHILQTCKKYGKFSTIYCNDAKSAKKYAAMGFDSVTIGLDLFCLANAYRDIVAEMHN